MSRSRARSSRRSSTRQGVTTVDWVWYPILTIPDGPVLEFELNPAPARTG